MDLLLVILCCALIGLMVIWGLSVIGCFVLAPLWWWMQGREDRRYEALIRAQERARRECAAQDRLKRS